MKGPAWLMVKSKAELAGVARQRLAPAVLLLLAADLSDRLAVALSMAMVVVHLVEGYRCFARSIRPISSENDLLKSRSSQHTSLDF